ncbi:DUF6555 family protein [Pseudomonas sp. RIT-To-2]|uniref:DUF6555 family protein n=1 Tax=Pseudomonas sp. RIT-To-2 TaxID=3462541 RepID=UPI0024133C3D
MLMLHRFEIRYCLHGRPHHFLQRDTLMTDADAWYYAALHAGTGLGMEAIEDNKEQWRQHAMAAGLSEVQWVKLA